MVEVRPAHRPGIEVDHAQVQRPHHVRGVGDHQLTRLAPAGEAHRRRLEPVRRAGRDPLLEEGLAGDAVTVPAGNLAPVVLRGLTLSGAGGIEAASTVELEEVSFENVTGTALSLTGGDHTAAGVNVAAGAQTAVVLAAGASLELERGEIRQTTGTAFEIDGAARVASTLIAGSGGGARVGAGV